jgi:hypothetical protein
MGQNPTEQNHGVPAIERHRNSRASARRARRGQRFAKQIGIDDQLACRAIRRAPGERRDDGDIALQNIPMDGEKVPGLLVIRISPAARRGNVKPTYARQRVGHLLAPVQPPMKLAACACPIGPCRIAAPAFRSVRIRHQHSFRLDPCKLRLLQQVLERHFVKQTANHEISAGSKQARLQNLCRRVVLPIETRHGSLMEHLRRHSERGGPSGGTGRWTGGTSGGVGALTGGTSGGVGALTGGTSGGAVGRWMGGISGGTGRCTGGSFECERTGLIG